MTSIGVRVDVHCITYHVRTNGHCRFAGMSIRRIYHVHVDELCQSVGIPTERPLDIHWATYERILNVHWMSV